MDTSVLRELLGASLAADADNRRRAELQLKQVRDVTLEKGPSIPKAVPGVQDRPRTIPPPLPRQIYLLGRIKRPRQSRRAAFTLENSGPFDFLSVWPGNTGLEARLLPTSTPVPSASIEESNLAAVSPV